jgi:hypothetical protein
MSRVRIGLSVPPQLPPAGIPAYARRAESAGFDEFCAHIPASSPHSTRHRGRRAMVRRQPAALRHQAGHPGLGQRLRTIRTSRGMPVTSRSYQYRKIHWSTASSESRAHQGQNDVYECRCCQRDCQEDSQPHGSRPTLNCLTEYRPAIRGSHGQENAIILDFVLRPALT